MIKVGTRRDTDLTVVIEECHFGVELGMDRIIEEDCSMLIIIEMTLGEEILGKHKIIEVSIIEVDVETTIEMITLEEVEVGPGKDNIQVTLEGMMEAVTDEVQEPVLLEIELEVLNVENMTILLITVLTQIGKEN